jgi:S1-C subfamily serine protease
MKTLFLNLKTAGRLAVWPLFAAMTMSAAAEPAWKDIGQRAQELFKQVSPYVVGVTVRPRQRAPETIDPTKTIQLVGDQDSDSWKDILDSQFRKDKVATGFIVSENGYILTTGSVLQSATGEQVHVTLHSGTILQATPVAEDDMTNLTILQVDRKFENVPSFAEAGATHIGMPVLAVTRPYGRSNSLFFGVVSNMEQELGQTRYENLIQTSLALHPGSIGGPILNFDGDIVGMLSTTQKQSSWPELSFAIPADMLSYVTREMITRGSVTRGFLGLWVFPLTHELRHDKNLPSQLDGVYVTRLFEDGAAHRADIRESDVITHFDGKPVTSYQQFIWHTAITPPGSTVPIRLWRNGETLEVPVTLEKMQKPTRE